MAQWFRNHPDHLGMTLEQTQILNVTVELRNIWHRDSNNDDGDDADLIILIPRFLGESGPVLCRVSDACLLPLDQALNAAEVAQTNVGIMFSRKNGIEWVLYQGMVNVPKIGDFV